VIVQTYTPEHYAIQAASRHDYQGFYLQETAQRRERGLPPYSRLVRLVYSATNEKKAQDEAERVARLLRQRIADVPIAGADVYQCAACFVARQRGHYRWQVVVSGSDPAAALAGVGLPPGWTVDVDPVSLL
jgi:primosomal protein N' (replication factor Y)